MGKNIPSNDVLPDTSADNIFDEFLESQSDDTSDTLKKEKEERTLYDYLRQGNYVLLLTNILLFFSIITFGAYNHIQSRESGDVVSFLEPICSLFIGSVYSETGQCTSVTSAISSYTKKEKEITSDLAKSILGYVTGIYSVENFNYSDNVTFLLDTSYSRLQALSILNDFDSIKREFTSDLERSNVDCSSILIDKNNTLSMNCEVLSSDWDTNIIELNEDIRTTTQGSSISRAASFIDFIHNHPSGKFKVISKPNSFTSTDINEGPYTKSSSFSIEVLYLDEKSILTL